MDWSRLGCVSVGACAVCPAQRRRPERIWAAGYVGWARGPDESAGDLARMCEAIRHRGPDDAGYFIAPGVALGMRRLSIIDVAGGAQPIANEDGSLQVVFNGEIYNYQEIRSRLEREGHRLVTGSDTETLVHLYED